MENKSAKQLLKEHFKKHHCNIDENGVEWILSLLEVKTDNSYMEIIRDFGINVTEVLVLYFSDLEKFEICVKLKNKISKYKTISQ